MAPPTTAPQGPPTERPALAPDNVLLAVLVRPLLFYSFKS
nr:MAG TPA: hypothetical protein [Crassvirales sp.]